MCLSAPTVLMAGICRGFQVASSSGGWAAVGQGNRQCIAGQARYRVTSRWNTCVAFMPEAPDGGSEQAVLVSSVPAGVGFHAVHMQYQLHAVVDVQLAEDMAEVIFHGALGHAQLPGDFLVR